MRKEFVGETRKVQGLSAKPHYFPKPKTTCRLDSISQKRKYLYQLAQPSFYIFLNLQEDKHHEATDCSVLPTIPEALPAERRTSPSSSCLGIAPLHLLYPRFDHLTSRWTTPHTTPHRKAISSLDCRLHRYIQNQADQWMNLGILPVFVAHHFIT